MGSDIHGNAMIIEQALEDAQNMHQENTSRMVNNLRGHARKISATWRAGGLEKNL
jgi:hypothetical protein